MSVIAILASIKLTIIIKRKYIANIAHFAMDWFEDNIDTLSEKFDESMDALNSQKTLNQVVEFENDRGTAHHVHEFIDIKRSSKDYFIVKTTGLGRVVDKCINNHINGQVSPKHLAMKQHVITEPLTKEEHTSIINIIHDYQNAKQTYCESKTYRYYDEMFAKGHQTSNNSVYEQSLDEVQQHLKSFDDEIEQIMKSKLKENQDIVDNAS